jgi:subtilisin family serine protease
MAGCDNSKSADSVSSQSTNADSCSTQAQALTQSRIVPNRFIVHWEDGHVSVEASENLALFKKRFVQANLQNIHHVENDQVITMQSVHVDASSIVTGNAPTWGPDLIQASTAWTKGATGQGISVAVVDAAVDYSHPQLKNQLAANTAEVNGQPGIDDDGNGYVDDFYGWDFDGNTNDPKALVSTTNDHGTHVSGIIAADHTSGPVQGVAPSAKIIPVNFMGSDGSGSLGLAIQAMQYAVSRGAKVINASWGGSQCSQTLKNVVTGLSDKNVLFVVAAGNDGVDLDSNPDYPANFNISNQITVGASNSNDYLDTWSNYSYSLVHLSAPGDTIFSTVPGATQAYMSGTSMAAPFVSGAAAALWSLRPNATPTQIKQALLAGVDKRSLATVSGGRLNLAASVQALLSALP